MIRAGWSDGKKGLAPPLAVVFDTSKQEIAEPVCQSHTQMQRRDPDENWFGQKKIILNIHTLMGHKYFK